MLIAIAAPISNSLPPQESNIALHTCTHGSLCEISVVLTILLAVENCRSQRISIEIG